MKIARVGTAFAVVTSAAGGAPLQAFEAAPKPDLSFGPPLSALMAASRTSTTIPAREFTVVMPGGNKTYLESDDSCVGPLNETVRRGGPSFEHAAGSCVEFDGTRIDAPLIVATFNTDEYWNRAEPASDAPQAPLPLHCVLPGHLDALQFVKIVVRQGVLFCESRTGDKNISVQVDTSAGDRPWALITFAGMSLFVAFDWLRKNCSIEQFARAEIEAGGDGNLPQPVNI